MSQPPQGDQPTEGRDDPAQGGTRPQGPGPQGYPQQPGFGPQQGYPGQQPYVGGPGAQGAYGGAPGGPAPYPPGAYPPGPYQPGQEPKKKRTGLFLLIGAGALALILAVVAVNLGGRNDGAGGGTTGGGGGTNAPAAASASDAVRGYLEAVAKGDVQAAVAFAAEPSTVSTTYMTPEVLAASAKSAPITGIEVETSDPDATSVPVTYQLGSTPVSTAYEVMKTSDDVWKLVSVATTIDLTAVRDESLPMLMNGTKVEPGPFDVLPGSYRFTTGQSFHDYGKKPELVVRYPADHPDITTVQPQISSKGQQAALSALRKSWTSCIDSDDVKPSGCPNRWNDKTYKFKNGSVDWDRKGSDPVKKPLNQVSTSSISYQVKIDLTLKGPCTINGRPGTCSGSLTGTALARADVSASKAKITWTS